MRLFSRKTYLFITTVFVFVLGFGTLEARAQYALDTESVDSIMEALYDVISGPANQERDWDRFRNLFIEEGKLIPIRVTPDTTHPVVWSVETYIERAGPQLKRNGFFEKEISRKTEEYGHIVHAFSTYESFRTLQDPEPFMRGINSIQLMHNGERWFIVNIMWDSERPDQIIPDKYLE